MKSMVIEWAPFRLKPGVTEEELRQAAAALQSGFLARQPGFIRRELLRGEDGAWCDLLYWETEEAVHAAMGRTADSPVCHRYFHLMSPADGEGGAEVRVLTITESYASA